MAIEISYKIITVDITYMFEKKFEKCPLASFQSLKSHELKDPFVILLFIKIVPEIIALKLFH